MNDDTRPPLPDAAQDDLNLQGYQDELDTDESMLDEATLDETDSPSEDLAGVPADELKDEMDGMAFDGSSDTADDDTREYIEDLDENDDSPAIPPSE